MKPPLSRKNFLDKFEESLKSRDSLENVLDCLGILKNLADFQYLIRDKGEIFLEIDPNVFQSEKISQIIINKTKV